MENALHFLFMLPSKYCFSCLNRQVCNKVTGNLHDLPLILNVNWNGETKEQNDCIENGSASAESVVSLTTRFYYTYL